MAKKGPKPRDPVERFLEKVEFTDGCWFWTASTNGVGYGKMVGSSDGGSFIYAHRFSYETSVGPIPDGLVLDHLCNTPHCVNPDHLEPVTQQENCIRAKKRDGKYRADTHGTVSCYISGCRCDECRAANAAQHLAWYHKRKGKL